MLYVLNPEDTQEETRPPGRGKSRWTLEGTSVCTWRSHWGCINYGYIYTPFPDNVNLHHVKNQSTLRWRMETCIQHTHCPRRGPARMESILVPKFTKDLIIHKWHFFISHISFNPITNCIKCYFFPSILHQSKWMLSEACLPPSHG